MPIHVHFWVVFGILASELGHSDLVCGVRSGIIGRSVLARLQVSLCVAVMICSSLVNIQTDTQTDRQTVFGQFISTAQSADDDESRDDTSSTSSW